MSLPRLLHRYWYRRVMVDFAVDPVRLNSLLKGRWTAAERYGGSNITMSFCTVLMDQDAEGVPLTVGRYRYAVLNGPGIDREGRPVHLRYLIYTDRRAAYPSCSVIELAAEHRSTFASSTQGIVASERYRFVGANGDLALTLRYRPDPGGRFSNWDEMPTEVHCVSDLAPHVESYRNEEFHHWVIDSQRGTNHAEQFKYKMQTRELAAVFDGSEQLISVHAVPMSVREVYAHF